MGSWLAKHDHHIESVTECPAPAVDCCPQLPLHAIARDSPPGAPARAQPDARPTSLRRERSDGQQRPVRPPSAARHGSERLRQLERGNGRARRWGRILHYAVTICQRPLLRRRLRILRPVRELMRWRKPWLRFRLRLDLFVRFFFIGLTIIRAARAAIKEKALEDSLSGLL